MMAADEIEKLAENIIINTTHGKMDLEEFAQMHIKNTMPFLEGTDIAKDPFKTTTLFLLADKEYFISECAIIPQNNGDFCSLTSALHNMPSGKGEDALKIIEIMDSYETLTNENIELEDFEIAARALNKAYISYSKAVTSEEIH